LIVKITANISPQKRLMTYLFDIQLMHTTTFATKDNFEFIKHMYDKYYETCFKNIVIIYKNIIHKFNWHIF